MSELFPSAGKFARGYSKDSVTEFFQHARSAYESGGESNAVSFDEVRRAAFPMVRDGYDTRSVDSALSRLESAFIQNERAQFVAQYGEEAWFAHIADDATVLYPRLLRPAGERFAHPEGRGVGYKASQVDELLDRLGDFFDDRATIQETDLRFAAFDLARGEKAYVEAQVDAFLAKAMYVLLAVS